MVFKKIIIILDVVKCDYSKEIDKKYQKMIFPETKGNLKGKKTMTKTNQNLYK
jgi:hypothetical protein